MTQPSTIQMSFAELFQLSTSLSPSGGGGEVQHLVHFTNRAHAFAEDMRLALDDPCFWPDCQGEPLPPEQVEGVDETHTLPNLDGVYKAIRASFFIPRKRGSTHTVGNAAGGALQKR